MLVRDRMSRKVITVDPQRSVAEAQALLRKHAVRQLPVVREGRLVGIVTDRDLRAASAAVETVNQVMTGKPMVVGPNAPVDEAARVLRAHKIGALPVVEGKALIGIITASDVLDAFVDLSGVREPTYHLVVSADDDADAERRIRRVIEQHRGELKWLHRDRHRRPPQVHLRLKARRIDDIVTELEAGGFEVNALVGSSGRKRA